MNSRTTLSTTALALSGVAMAWYAGARIGTNPGFEYQPNPLGLNGSPYGQVIAMAIQAPIDADWHGVLEFHDESAESEGDHDSCSHGDEHCTHDHELASHDCESEDCGHDHAPASSDHHCSDPDCGHDHGSIVAGTFVDRLSGIVKKRTNPNPPTPAHKFYIRAEIEKKLRFAYSLDPSHYANYAAYHLFLTEAELGTSDNASDLGREFAISLAKHTIRYCLREEVDPRPALTAAAAAYNILEAMFMNPDDYTTAQMREQLGDLDFCLKRHFDILMEATSNGTWESISEMRQQEVLDRSHLALKLREAAEKTILRLESPQDTTASHDPS